MPFNSKIAELKDRFGITRDSDWSNVTPDEIREVHGVGDGTLDYIRAELALRDLTLRNDHTPEYWKRHPRTSRVGGATLAWSDNQPVCPFTILIDSAEQQPFLFRGIKADGWAEADQQGEVKKRYLIVPTDGPRPGLSLGRHPHSTGDYSIDGFVGKVGIERKSMSDLHSTILGFRKEDDGVSRRDRFECELANLARMEASLVVVESTFEDVIINAPTWGTKTKQQNARTLAGSIRAYWQDHKVPWCMVADRRTAEVTTFRFLERYWEKQADERKQLEKLVAAM